MAGILIAGLPGQLGTWLAQRLNNVVVQAAFSGQEALDAVRADEARLVVLDASLEDPPADAVVRRLRADPKTASVPLVYTMELDASTVKEEQLRHLVRDLHVDQLLFHPVDRSELLRAVATLLGMPLTEGEAVPTPRPAESAPERLGDALTQVWRRARGPVLERIAVLERAAAALGAGRLSEPLREEALREAHRLAGALGTFGLDHGSVRAREAEDALRHPSPAQADGARIARIAAELRNEVDRRPTSAPAAPAAAPPIPNDPPLVWVMARDWGLAETARAELSGLGVAVAEGDTDPALRPDAVFLDLRAESLDAEWDTFSSVTRRAPGVPVVAYTDRDTLLDRVRALKMGARFILQPPLARGAIADAFAQVLPAPGAEAHTILTVDDDSTITEGLRALLEPQGFRVRTLNDPLRFWTELRGIKPDLLVLDVDMPHLNGIELCRVVRSDPAWRHVPILFLTARADRETIYRVFAAGADDYLSKPIVGPELVSRIRNRLDRRR